MKEVNLTETMQKLKEINDWFENNDDIDIEESLQKVKEGFALVKASKERLKEIENQFELIKKDMED